jgi:hypothetical protein
MAIEELLSVVRPPRRPVEAGEPDELPDIERRLGISLPKDYVDFGLRYGTGVFVDSGRLNITVLNPFSDKYIERVKSDSAFLLKMKEIVPQEVPYDIFPKSPGLLRWGYDDNGWELCWLTLGSPESWPVLFSNSRDIHFERVEMPMSSFLARSFSRTLRTVLWSNPEFFSGRKRLRFVPVKHEE